MNNRYIQLFNLSLKWILIYPKAPETLNFTWDSVQTQTFGWNEEKKCQKPDSKVLMPTGDTNYHEDMEKQPNYHFDISIDSHQPGKSEPESH